MYISFHVYKFITSNRIEHKFVWINTNNGCCTYQFVYCNIICLHFIPVGIYCRLEQESGFYFNMRHFGEMVMNGEWDEVEKYLSGFTKVNDNRYSLKIFFEIRKQKYLEALDRYVLTW